VFEIVILMRFVPTALQPWLIWLLPAKWKLEANLRKLETYVVPEVKRMLAQKELPKESYQLSWMIQGSRNDTERDPWILSRLQAATAAGGTHSVGMFILHALYDLVTHPELMEEVCEEIRVQQHENGGRWEYGSYDSLAKLDSALKETARTSPPTMTVYNRLMLSDYTLSNGVHLRKGGLIAVSGCSVQGDESIFPDAKTYDGLRAYKQTLADGKARPFKGADHELGWGAGRWACPGRYLANIETKLMLVKLLQEYEFQMPAGKTHPTKVTFHDFGFIDDHEKLQVRRRRNAPTVGY
jgi:cytochrome P450